MINAVWLDKDISEALKIRHEVFVIEQNVPEEDEYDGRDAGAHHVLAYVDGKPAGCGRVSVLDGKCYPGRLAVRKEFRKMGVGELIMRMLIRRAFNMGYNEQYIHAQIAALGFYEKLGYKPFGEEFIESGIPHTNMVHAGDV